MRAKNNPKIFFSDHRNVVAVDNLPLSCVFISSVALSRTSHRLSAPSRSINVFAPSPNVPSCTSVGAYILSTSATRYAQFMIYFYVRNEYSSSCKPVQDEVGSLCQHRVSWSEMFPFSTGTRGVVAGDWQGSVQERDQCEAWGFTHMTSNAITQYSLLRQ